MREFHSVLLMKTVKVYSTWSEPSPAVAQKLCFAQNAFLVVNSLCCCWEVDWNLCRQHSKDSTSLNQRLKSVDELKLLRSCFATGQISVLRWHCQQLCPTLLCHFEWDRICWTLYPIKAQTEIVKQEFYNKLYLKLWKVSKRHIMKRRQEMKSLS